MFNSKSDFLAILLIFIIAVSSSGSPLGGAPPAEAKVQSLIYLPVVANEDSALYNAVHAEWGDSKLSRLLMLMHDSSDQGLTDEDFMNIGHQVDEGLAPDYEDHLNESLFIAGNFQNGEFRYGVRLGPDESDTRQGCLPRLGCALP